MFNKNNLKENNFDTIALVVTYKISYVKILKATRQYILIDFGVISGFGFQMFNR